MKKKFFKYLLSIFILIMCGMSLHAVHQPEFSAAGFFELPNTGRQAYNMNPAWRFHKGHIDQAEMFDFDDSKWEVLSLPNGIELLSSEASGCVNYQGEVWYRKHFVPEEKWKGKKIFLHFEAIMGKSKIWINGILVKEHFGGFLPIIADITDYIKFNQKNVIAVYADNSDDPTYPPGKPQDMLDFSYFGGIYRDCWLVVHNRVFLTDPNYEDIKAGGGLFVSFGKISEEKAEIQLDAHIRNCTKKNFSGKIIYELYDRNQKLACKAEQKISVANGQAKGFKTGITVRQPHLWGPESPYLYQLHILVKDLKNNIVDGYRRRIGIRSIEFKGKDGFWLNGKPYPEPLIGANRHQDFAVIGNALSNSLHWRDAKKLRDAGLRVIRNAHYPQDPAFMDACDELGLFVIVNTPGWQFWNNEPIFAQRVYNDIRNMVRRDRNHPSVWLWEPILNETWYPEDFAKNVVDIVNEEYPYSYCYTACDIKAKGKEHFPVQFMHPLNGLNDGISRNDMDSTVAYFTREWGDNVDDWSSHNSPSRVSRSWGEIPMLIQAQGYAKTDYQYTNYDVLYRTPRQHMGGCLWHSFDHQRGYHPDPFYGGIMDAYRQPKLSYYMFCAQRPPYKNPELISESGPIVYIANAMTPFSPKDVTIYSNCDEVRLIYCKDGTPHVYKKNKQAKGMPSPIIVFPGVWDVMHDKELTYKGRHAESYLLAEGLMDGKIVATHKVYPARRPSKIMLWIDNEGVETRADGSDLVTVIAAITDDQGNIKRLNNSIIRFEIEGPGELVANEEDFTNPKAIQWGTVPILVRALPKSGDIRIKAALVKQGKHTPISAEIILHTKSSERPLIMYKEELKDLWQQSKIIKENTLQTNENSSDEMRHLQQKQNRLRLKEVEQQQRDFE